MSKIFKPRRGSKAVMQSSKGNTVLAAGEMFVEFEGTIGNSLASIKFGDGSTAYSSLPYALKNVDPTSTAITITPDGSTTSAAALNNVVSNASLGSMIGSLKQAISLTKTEINTSVDSRLSINNTPFYFDYQNSKYGYNTSPTREAASFHPFREPHTATYTASSRSASLDMGEDHIYRYVNTNSVPNNNTTTYTYAANSTGGTVDLGATNVYRYVNAANVYNKGKADGVTIHTGTYTPTSRAASLDMGQTHTYRYVNTNSVPNTNSSTYTYAANSTGGTVDMGATNTYRYVNASNVYNKGKADGGAINFVKLGHFPDTTTYNVTAYANYRNFTPNNFVFQNVAGSGNCASRGEYDSTGCSMSIDKSYDNGTGILTLSGGTGHSQTLGPDWTMAIEIWTSLSADVYLVYTN